MTEPAPTLAVESAADIRCALGEGPTWDAAHGVARWVDIDGGHLWQAPVAANGVGRAGRILDCGPTLGAAVHTEDGGLLLARTHRLEHRDATGATVDAVRLIPEGVASRLNDGACDPAGRYLVGSLAQDGRRGQERLWRLEHDGTVTVLDDDLNLSNGLAWSPDGSLFYSVDSVPGTVWVRDYDPDTRATGRQRSLIEIRDGVPDGLTVDAEGNLWVALWGPGEVRCYTPQGRLAHVLHTGAPLTTSCAFAGPDLDLLIITSASKAEDGVRQTDRGGAVLVARPGVTGKPTTAWQPGVRAS
jgi:sugar lactone lactonase YvrE